MIAERRFREQVVAEALARFVHHNQTLMSSNESYIMHPSAVASALPDSLKAAGWLHDVIEDAPPECPITPIRLVAAGISLFTATIVDIVSRTENETYERHIQRVATSGNRGAIEVKLADLRHNLRPGCPPSLRERYERAVPILTSALETTINGT